MSIYNQGQGITLQEFTNVSKNAGLSALEKRDMFAQFLNVGAQMFAAKSDIKTPDEIKQDILKEFSNFDQAKTAFYLTNEKFHPSFPLLKKLQFLVGNINITINKLYEDDVRVQFEIVGHDIKNNIKEPRTDEYIKKGLTNESYEGFIRKLEILILVKIIPNEYIHLALRTAKQTLDQTSIGDLKEDLIAMMFDAESDKYKDKNKVEIIREICKINIENDLS